MNTPPSDVNESIIDIFVLGGSPAGSPLIRDHLEQKGYRVTLFTESAQLLEALRSGKPNLLIGDATSGESYAFQVCRQIKTDENLWMIPVLVVTTVSNLGDLLRILDCNADAFIPYPYDPRYFLSLIEGMLTTPVERLTPDQITTQFKIQHDDQIYVVTADRRKLLEFLLSSFELAVDLTGELAKITSDVSALSANLKKSKETIFDHSRSIDALNAALQRKEEREKTLTGQLEDQEARITGQDAEIAHLSHELDETKSLLSAAQENIRTMLGEREETARAHQSETDDLVQNVSKVSAELKLLQSQYETVTAELETVKRDLGQETALYKAAAEKAGELARQNEGLEERLVTLDAERCKALSVVDEEKNRAFVAEEDARSARKAREESEENLKRKIIGIEEELSLRSADLNRLTALLEAETGHSAEATARIQTLEQEHEESEAILRSNVVTIKQQLTDLQAEYDSVVAALDNEEQRTKNLETDLVTAAAAAQKAEEDLRSISDQLVEARTAHESDLMRIKYLEEDLSASAKARQESETSVSSLSSALDDARAALDKEKELHRVFVENLNTRIQELEIAWQTLETDSNAIRSDLEAESAFRTDLEARLALAENKKIDLESDFATVSEELRLSVTQVKSLSDKLEQVRTELEAEQTHHKNAEERETSLAAVQNQYESTLRSEKDDRKLVEDRLNEQITALNNEYSIVLAQRNSLEQQIADLTRDAKERETSLAAVQNQYESTLRSEKDDRKLVEDRLNEQITALNNEYSIVLAQRNSLEQQVADLNREFEQKKTAADQKFDTLESELHQARTALADEWEDHMNTDERLAAAVEERQQLRQSRSREEPGEMATTVVKNDPGALVSVIPDFHAHAPVDRPEIHKASDKELVDNDIAILPTSESQPATYESGIDDLFEPVSDRSPDQLNPPQQLSGSSPDLLTESSADESFFSETGDNTQVSVPEEQNDTITNTAVGSGSVGTIPRGNISFNRQQWFDLLRWAHHADSITQNQRMQIVRMGRLIQQGRNLTKKQEEQVREILVLAHTLGFRNP
jgi:DNA-binding response OmpR family regulator